MTVGHAEDIQLQQEVRGVRQLPVHPGPSLQTPY